MALSSRVGSISERKEIFGHLIAEPGKDGMSVPEAFKHYQTCADMLREVIKEEGTLREQVLIDDIWKWEDEWLS